MERKEALQLLQGGFDSVQRWNRWRQKHTVVPPLRHAYFVDADLTDANLSETNLEKGNFLRARLVGTLLDNTNLTDANLRQANLNHARLINARLIRVNLKGANLCGADLRRAIFKDINFEKAECDIHTKWPEGFDPKSVGLEPWPE
jgi:hypothetical protein